MQESCETPEAQRRSRILVVDDDEGVRSLLKKFFSQRGFETVAVEDGSRAIESVKNGGFDIHLIDVRMPGLNGVETLRGIRRIAPEAVVVMMTGYADEDLLDQALKEGVVDILHKPFSVSRLTGIVERIRSGPSPR